MDPEEAGHEAGGRGVEDYRQYCPVCRAPNKQYCRDAVWDPKDRFCKQCHEGPHQDKDHPKYCTRDPREWDDSNDFKWKCRSGGEDEWSCPSVMYYTTCPMCG